MKPADEGPGLPGLRTWRSVYLFVAGSFAVWVIGLIVLERVCR